jgi:hypothetical protein
MSTTDAGRPRNSRPDHCDQLALFGKPPLFEGEENAYRELLTKISSALMPGDIFEKIWTQEYVYRTIEVLRLRRVEVNLTRVNEYKGLCEALTPIVGRPEAETLAAGWAARHADVVKQVKKILRSAGLSADSILAQTFSLTLNEIERVKDMIAVAEARRNATLREIDRHRKTLGQELRCIAQQVEHDELQ